MSGTHCQISRSWHWHSSTTGRTRGETCLAHYVNTDCTMKWRRDVKNRLKLDQGNKFFPITWTLQHKQTRHSGFMVFAYCHVTEELHCHTTMLHLDGVHAVHPWCCSAWSLMEQDFNIMVQVLKQGIGAVASQLKIQPIKSDNMLRWTSYTDTWK